MTQTSHEAATQNPALESFQILVGEWNTEGTHRLLPGKTLRGRTSFTWTEGGAFLVMRSQVPEQGIPASVCIIGTDEALGECSMLYFDDRKVSREYRVALSEDRVWSCWRNAPQFSQRFRGEISSDGNTIVGVWELSEDDATWTRDLELTYTRVR